MELVKFYATWCGPCKLVAPAVQKVAEEAGLPVREVDIDNNSDLVVRYNVQSVPTIIKVDNGVEVARVTGAKPVRILREELGL